MVKRMTLRMKRAMFARAGAKRELNSRGSISYVKKKGQSLGIAGRTKSAKADKNIKALHAGKRLSANGNVYYEKRKNRSDRSRIKNI